MCLEVIEQGGVWLVQLESEAFFKLSAGAYLCLLCVCVGQSVTDVILYALHLHGDAVLLVVVMAECNQNAAFVTGAVAFVCQPVVLGIGVLYACQRIVIFEEVIPCGLKFFLASLHVEEVFSVGQDLPVEDNGGGQAGT